MQSGLTGLVLVLSVGAIAISGYALLQDRDESPNLEGRLDAIDDRVARIERAVNAQARKIEESPLLGAKDADSGGPSLVGVPGFLKAEAEAEGGDTEMAAPAPADAAEGPEAEQKIQELVDKAVEKKAAQMQQMRNKKPSMDAFAKTLELNEQQRQAVEREVVRGQREIYEILNTPSEDGTIFLDELVEVMADGMANPGKNPGRWQKLFARLVSEKVPGSDETYAGKAEAVKKTVRASFRREFTKGQYAMFEQWRMDPTEIKEVPGTPWKELEVRLIERAKALGAKIPDRDK